MLNQRVFKAAILGQFVKIQNFDVSKVPVVKKIKKCEKVTKTQRSAETIKVTDFWRFQTQKYQFHVKLPNLHTVNGFV